MLIGLLGGLLASGTGCGIFCCGSRCGQGNCDQGFCGGPCDDGCGPTCGPTQRSFRGPVCAPRQTAACSDCGDCGCDPCADPCGDGCCGRCWYSGPLSCFFALFTRCNWCGPNCGERYWGDFYSDPPDCEDPCDCYGNRAGGCCSCGGGRRNGQMYQDGGGYGDGEVYQDGGGFHDGGGCKNCGRSAAYGHLTPQPQADDGQPMDDGNVVSQGDGVVPTPTPATGQPHKATRP